MQARVTGLLAVSSVLINQHQIFSKVVWNRHTLPWLGKCSLGPRWTLLSNHIIFFTGHWITKLSLPFKPFISLDHSLISAWTAPICPLRLSSNTPSSCPLRLSSDTPSSEGLPWDLPFRARCYPGRPTYHTGRGVIACVPVYPIWVWCLGRPELYFIHLTA